MGCSQTVVFLAPSRMVSSKNFIVWSTRLEGFDLAISTLAWRSMLRLEVHLWLEAV